jgi:hypothetical protein
MQAQPSFSAEFRASYAAHETIHAIFEESGGGQMDVTNVARRVRQAYPDLDIEPNALIEVIRQAMMEAIPGT